MKKTVILFVAMLILACYGFAQTNAPRIGKQKKAVPVVSATRNPQKIVAPQKPSVNQGQSDVRASMLASRLDMNKQLKSKSSSKAVGDTVSTFPWTEDFESGLAPVGFTFVDADGDGYNWEFGYLYGQGYGHGGSDGFSASASWNNTEGALTPNNWMILPTFTLPATATDYELSWYEKGQDASYSSEYYSVYISTTGRTPAHFTATTAVLSSTTTGSWVHKTVSLSAYAGQTINIAFRHYNVTDMFYLDIDDITVGGPSAPIVSIVGPDNIFVGDTGTYEAVSDNATSYVWNITADYLQTNGNQAEVSWSTNGTKTLSVTATNSVGNTTATKTVNVFTPSYVNVTNNGDGYVYVWNSIVEGFRVHTPESVPSFAGDTLWLQCATFAPWSEYYGFFSSDSSSRLLSFIVDGDTIPLDGTDANLFIVDDLSDYGYILYEYPVVYGAQTHNVVANYGPYYGDDTDWDTVTLTNVGGGYMYAGVNDNDGIEVTSTAQITGTAGDVVYVDLATFAPTSQFYGEYCDATNAQLVSLTVDGVNIPLDGSNPSLSVYNYLSEDGYIFYEYLMPLDGQNHAVVATFGPYTGIPGQHTVTVTHNGGLVISSVSDGFLGTQASFYGTASDTLGIAAVSFYDSDFANQFGIQDNRRIVKHIYVDNVEQPLSSLEYYYDSEDNFAEYVLYIAFDTDHVVDIVFGGEDTYTVTAQSNDETQGFVHGGGEYSGGQTAVLVAVCQYGIQFAGWSNGSTDNPLYLTVNSDVTVMANFVPGNGGIIHDTIYIVDTVYVGIGQVEVMNVKVYGSNGQVVVEGAEGYDVALYDILGRVVATRRSDSYKVNLDVPVTGTYLVRVGNHTARKVVVTR